MTNEEAPQPTTRRESLAARLRAGSAPAAARVGVAACALLLGGCDPLREGAATPRGPVPGEVERGRQLVAQYQCGSCHSIPRVPAAKGGIGPSLEAFGRRAYIAGQLPNRPATLEVWIAEPSALIPGTAMPDMGASQEDARDMAAFLMSLK